MSDYEFGIYCHKVDVAHKKSLKENKLYEMVCRHLEKAKSEAEQWEDLRKTLHESKWEILRKYLDGTSKI